MGIHESQSRLWENLVGRSRAFWEHYFAAARARFSRRARRLDATQLHRAINVVRAGANRVDADEATYNLHILVRYELELALLDGDLRVADLPGAWDERYAQYLGVTPPTRATAACRTCTGRSGEFGYFPTYTLGNLYAAQLAEAYERGHDLGAELRAGDLQSLRAWLARSVYAHGAELQAEALIEAATGERSTRSRSSGGSSSASRSTTTDGFRGAPTWSHLRTSISAGRGR